jgi:ribonucleotide monophosphatase NagD (HAD superfamily)
MMYICKRLVGYQATFAGKPAPTGMMYICKRLVDYQATFAGKPRSYKGGR